ncbi:MAG: response regulator [Nitrosospira sp.]
MAPEPSVKILIVDNHPLWVSALRNLLATQSGFHVVADTDDARSALGYACLPVLDLVIMDISLFHNDDTAGIDLTTQFHQKHPKIKVLMCSAHDRAEYVQRSKEAGARGYVIKSETVNEILRVIYEVIGGNESWPLVYPPSHDIKRPTPTELQVLKYLVRGMTTAQIAAQLAMVEANVSAHRHNIKTKHGLATQPQLVIFAQKCMDLYGIPADLDLTAELEQLVESFLRDTGIRIKFKGDTEGFSNTANTTLYKVALEALSNIRRHAAAARTVSMQLKASFSWITITICDDGVGFNADRIDGESKSGLYNLNKILRGELVLTSSPDGGTSVTAKVRRTIPL